MNTVFENMDFENIFKKIKELGHSNNKRDELREFCKQEIDKILDCLSRRILKSDGANILDCLLNGLPEVPEGTVSIKTKVKVLDIVMTSMRSELTSLTHCGDVVSRLCLELARMPAEDLLRWSNDSIQSIVEDSDLNMIWRDVLPECLSALSSHGSVRHCGTELTVDEYKEQCIHTLCQCRWKEKQLVQLAAMFKDMQLPRNEHKQVVNKICSYMIDFPPETLPALVHQLLKLCKVFHVEVVLAHLSHYFNMRVYGNIQPPPEGSESTTMDIDDIVQYSPSELTQCLSTCIYHISQGAAEPEVIRRHLKLWPRTQLMHSPFMLDVALALSDKGADFRTVCLDVIKSSVEMVCQDSFRARESAAARAALPPAAQPAAVLKLITTESTNHQQLTVVGLVNLAFQLLSVPRTKPWSSVCWSHGKLVLARLCRQQPAAAPTVLSKLADRLTTEGNQTQFAACLLSLCALSPVAIERCSQLTTILECCQPPAGAAVLDAVHPLLNFSMRTRDALVMVCRKMLYSRESSYRCLALSGFLTLLRHVRLSRRGLPASEGSAHSCLTQLTCDVHATQQGGQVTSRVRNEAMCLEVVAILRRCLGQDQPVKQMLYTQLYNCAKEKIVLHESILELLYDHLCKYLPDDAAGSPLLLDKCVQMNATTAVLTEPIAHLLYAAAQFTQPVDEDLEDILSSQSNDTTCGYLKAKLTTALDRMCSSEGFGRIEMDDPGLTDLSPESKAKSLKVQQVLQCYEALIAYQILHWNRSSGEEVPNKVYKLYKDCAQLLEQTKSQPKISKKGSKSTLNETRETVKSQKSQKSQKGKGPVKVNNLVKDRAGPFKPLPCLWDLNFCQRVVELLYNEDVPWCTLETRNILRSKREFQQWALRGIAGSLPTADRHDARTAANIASVLYHRCLCRFQAMCEFDDQTTLCCLDLFKECLTVLFLPSHALKMERFLPTITGNTVDPSVNISAILSQILSALTRLESEEEAGAEPDITQRRLTATLVATAAMLLEVPVDSDPDNYEVVEQYTQYIRKSRQEWSPLLGALLTAVARGQGHSSLLDDLFKKLHTALGRIDEEEETSTECSLFPSLTTQTAHAALGTICSHLVLRLRPVEHLLHRARDMGNGRVYAVHQDLQKIDKDLTRLYKAVVLQLSAGGTWVSSAALARCSVGAGSDRVVQAATRLYQVLAALARQIDPAMAETVRLDRLLKTCGRKLSGSLDALIPYLEAAANTTSGGAARVLRDTKLIPRLVLAAEQFNKNIVLLDTRGKVNYQQYLSLGTARDFRIKAPILQEVLQAQARDDTREEDDIHDLSTEIPEANDQEDDSEGEQSPQRKRRKS